MVTHMLEQPADMTVETAGKIGPNAVIQTVAALVELRGAAGAREVLERIGRLGLIDYRPGSLIDEREFETLHRELVGALGPAEAGMVMARAGALTAQYVIANRIPRPAQRALRLLPRAIALRLLLGAIGQHTWTFAGSGRFSYTLGQTRLLAIENCLTARGMSGDAPACAFYQSAFQGFLTTLIDSRLRVREVRCASCGAPRCEFKIIGEVVR